VSSLDTPPVTCSVSGLWARVELGRPEARHAQTPVMWRAWQEALGQLPGEVRLVTVHGSVAAFSAGLDRSVLADAAGLAGLSHAQRVERIAEFQSAFGIWHSLPGVLTIAIVEGPALGAGMQLALACDLMWIGPAAWLQLPEVSLGLVPDLTGTARLIERAGAARALELAATGWRLSAEQALAWGIATRLLPDGPAEAAAEVDRACTEILALPPAALSQAVDLMRAAGRQAGADQQVRERQAQARLLAGLAAGQATR